MRKGSFYYLSPERFFNHIMPTKVKQTPSTYLEALRSRVLIFDGAMGTELQKYELTQDNFGGEPFVGLNDVLSLFYPQVVEAVHRSYLDAGADVIETNTFRSNPFTLAEYGLAERCDALNLASARLARKLADEYTKNGQQRFVAGSLGPSGILLSLPDQNPRQVIFDQIVAAYQQQASALLTGGVDLFLLETSQDILEVKAAIIGIQKACQYTGTWLPIQAQVTLDTSGRMLAGTDIGAVQAILDGAGVAVIGLNCSTGPEHMRDALEILTARTALPVSCLPNAGFPINVDGKAVYPLSPEDFTKHMADFVERLGINIAGGCCGTTPEHIRQLARRLDGCAPLHRSVLSIPRLSSAIHAVDMRQVPAPFLIGERLNTQGSRVFKNAMLNDDFSTAARLAEQQVNAGAHGLDLCTALTEKDNEVELMTRLVQTIASVTDAALIIDSTDPDVMQAALKTAPGRCLLNSIHLEDGGTKARAILQMAVEYNVAVLALTIDEKGMARSAQRKLEIAKRIAALAHDEFGFNPDRLVFDPLTFTVASGEPESAIAARETLRALSLIKSEIPGALTSLGVSNVSFGLSAPTRAVLNSVFLHLAVASGLDMAIVNPAQVRALGDIPVEVQQAAEDVLFNRSPEALSKLIALTTSGTASDFSSVQDLPVELGERLRERVLRRRKDGLLEDIDAFVNPNEPGTSERAVRLLNEILLPAMQEVGNRFGSGELILPFVLQAAEVMKIAADRLQQYLDKHAGASRGRVVLATVYGDIHDIGKNLVHTILANNGYEVIDLGKQIPAEEIADAAQKQRADAVGLSALLVSTSQQMPLVVRALRSRGLTLPVLVGGAAVNALFAERIALDEEGKIYAGGVHYCRDAFDALKILEKRVTGPISSAENVNHFVPLPEPVTSASPSASQIDIISRYQPAPIPSPQFWGARVLDPLPLEELFERIDLKSLYRLSWGARNARGEKWEKLRVDFDRRLNDMKTSALEQGWLQPAAVYGFWPVHTDGSFLYIHDPQSDQVLGQMHLARKADTSQRSLADYFSPNPSKLDVVAFQVVTAGRSAGDYIRALHSGNDFTEAYFSHGLAVQNN